MEGEQGISVQGHCPFLSQTLPSAKRILRIRLTAQAGNHVPVPPRPVTNPEEWYFPIGNGLIEMDHQMEGPIFEIAAGVVGVDPHALVRFRAAEAASQGHTDLAGRFGADTRSTDRRIVDAFTDIAGEDHFVHALSDLVDPPDITPPYQRTVGFHDRPEVAGSATAFGDGGLPFFGDGQFGFSAALLIRRGVQGGLRISFFCHFSMVFW